MLLENQIVNPFFSFILQRNFKISPAQYHWRARLQVRMHNTTRLAGDYIEYEQAELASYSMGIPSPRGSKWRTYIQSRLKTLPRGMAVYATREYAKIRLTQYIDSTRAMDEIAKQITGNKPSVFHIGGSEPSPNTPIGM